MVLIGSVFLLCNMNGPHLGLFLGPQGWLGEAQPTWDWSAGSAPGL